MIYKWHEKERDSLMGFLFCGGSFFFLLFLHDMITLSLLAGRLEHGSEAFCCFPGWDEFQKIIAQV